jgi:hypothetical protein
MLFHSALGQLHGLGDLAVGAAVDAVEQEDLPARSGKAQRRLDALQVMVDLQGLFGAAGAKGSSSVCCRPSATRSRLPSLRK